MRMRSTVGLKSNRTPSREARLPARTADGLRLGRPGIERVDAPGRSKPEEHATAHPEVDAHEALARLETADRADRRHALRLAAVEADQLVIRGEPMRVSLRGGPTASSGSSSRATRGDDGNRGNSDQVTHSIPPHSPS
jgi:hypothetical protein